MSRVAHGLSAFVTPVLAVVFAVIFFVASAPADAAKPEKPAAAALAPDGKKPVLPEPPKMPAMSWTGILGEDEFKKLHELRTSAVPELRGEMIELAGGHAYLSLPEGEGPHPGIVVIQEWWGLNDNIKHWSDRLAADGFAALAVDLYEGRVATTRDEAYQYMQEVEDARSIEILQAAYAYLGDDPRNRAPKRGCIGWCFGGGWSLRLALAQPDLDAAVIYYGRLIDDPEQLDRIGARICGVFGNRDGGIPPEAVDAFEAGLREAGVDHEIHRYDADHAFANPSSARYDHESAGKAWREVRAFLAEALQE